MLLVVLQNLVETQETIRRYVPGFTFNLGICGYYFNKGTGSEINGSRSLVRNRDKFWWFGHTYNHHQPHRMNETVLEDNMHANLEFAGKHFLPITKNHYSVSPHHSGIYPVHEPLYRAWQKLLNVSVTSTEEYPHMYPPHRRRGFIHHGIMVCTCGGGLLEVAPCCCEGTEIACVLNVKLSIIVELCKCSVCKN